MKIKHTLIITLLSLVMLLGYGFSELTNDETYDNLYGEVISGDLNDFARPYGINAYAIPSKSPFDETFMRKYFNYMTGGNFTFKEFTPEKIVEENNEFVDHYGIAYTNENLSVNWFTKAFKLTEKVRDYEDIGCIFFVNPHDYDLLTHRKVTEFSKQHFSLTHELMHCHALYYADDLEPEKASYAGFDIWSENTSTTLDKAYNEYINEVIADVGSLIMLTSKYELNEKEFSITLAHIMDKRMQAFDEDNIFKSLSGIGHFTNLILKQLEGQYQQVKNIYPEFKEFPLKATMDLIQTVDRLGLSKRSGFLKTMTPEYETMMRKYAK